MRPRRAAPLLAVLALAACAGAPAATRAPALTSTSSPAPTSAPTAAPTTAPQDAADIPTTSSADPARDAALTAAVARVAPPDGGRWAPMSATELADDRRQDDEWVRSLQRSPILPTTCQALYREYRAALLGEVARASIGDDDNGVYIDVRQLADPSATLPAVGTFAVTASRCPRTTMTVEGTSYTEVLVPVDVPVGQADGVAAAVSSWFVDGQLDGDPTLQVRARRGAYVVEVDVVDAEDPTAEEIRLAGDLAGDVLDILVSRPLAPPSMGTVAPV